MSHIGILAPARPESVTSASVNAFLGDMPYDRVGGEADVRDRQPEGQL